jgi:hypothetical protein
MCRGRRVAEAGAGSHPPVLHPLRARLVPGGDRADNRMKKGHHVIIEADQVAAVTGAAQGLADP